MGYVVTGPMALVDKQDGTIIAVQRGGAVPDNVTDEHLAHLLTVGLVAQVGDGDTSGGLEPTRTGSGAPVKAEPNPDDLAGPGGRPAKSAAKADWVAYAVTQGADQAEAEGHTKEELVAAYGA